VSSLAGPFPLRGKEDAMLELLKSDREIHRQILEELKWDTPSTRRTWVWRSTRAS
jgi:hypothetical protein